MVSTPPPSLRQRVASAASQLRERLGGRRPRAAMLLGTGHSSIAAQLQDRVTLHADDLPSGLLFAQGTPLVFGTLENVPVVVSDAPLASYEGHNAEEVTFPVRVLRELGAEFLVLTAGAASLRQQIEPGMLAIVEDHLNFSSIHPLQGPPDEALGPRFPDMSDPYTARWRRVAAEVAREGGLPATQGVFAAVPGPSLPTRAEYRFLRTAGADLVGMSLVPEVLAAVHSGMEVLAVVGVTQLVSIETPEPASIEAMLDAADLAAPRMAALLCGVLRRLA